MWKRVLTAGLLVGAAVSAETLPPAEDGWQVYVSRAGGFQVELPVDPVVQRDEERLTLLGTVTGEVYSARAGELLLAVEVRELPRLATALVPDHVILEATRQGVEADLDAVEIESHEITLQGLPARDFAYRVPGEPPDVERALVVLVDGRLYVVTGRAREGSEGPALDHFFRSFRVQRGGEAVGARETSGGR